MPQLMNRNQKPGSSRPTGATPDAANKPPEFNRKVLNRLVDMTAEQRFQQMQEAEAQGVPPEHTLKTLLSIYDPQSQQVGTIDPSGLDKTPITLSGAPDPGGMRTAQPTQLPRDMSVNAAMGGRAMSAGEVPGQPQARDPYAPTGVQGPRNILEFLFQQSGIDPSTGTYKTGGVYSRGPQLEDYEKAQALAGKKPLQAGEREKAELDSEKSYASLIFGKQLDAAFKKDEERTKKLEGAEKVSNDLVSLVDAYDSIHTGPVEGRMAQTAELVTGRNAAAQNFESMADSIVFSLGEFVTGQGGRSLSDAEQERLRDIFRISRTHHKGEFEGKLQAAINLINNRMPSGSVKLPPAKEMVRAIREKRKGSQQPTATASKGGGGKALTVGRFQIEVE